MPSGICLGSFSESDAEFVFNMAKESRAESIDAVKIQITKQPSIYLTDEKGEIVASCVQYLDGPIGMVQVQEKHRGKGLGKLLVSSMTRAVTGERGFGHAVIDRDNIVSKNLFITCGYKECSDTVVFLRNDCDCCEKQETRS